MLQHVFRSKEQVFMTYLRLQDDTNNGILHLLQAYILEKFKNLGTTSIFPWRREIIEFIHDPILSRALRRVCGATACQLENRVAGVVSVIA